MARIEKLILLAGELAKELAVLLFLKWIEQRKKKPPRKPS
jgi:hypothetical protein